MKLLEALQKEHSKAQRDRIAAYVGNDRRRFADLIAIFLNSPFRVAHWASWAVNPCVQRHPELVYPHVPKLLRHLRKPGIHDAVKRNTFRMLQFVNIPPKYQGQVVNACFEFFTDTTQAVAIRVFAMRQHFHGTARPEERNPRHDSIAAAIWNPCISVAGKEGDEDDGRLTLRPPWTTRFLPSSTSARAATLRSPASTATSVARR